MAFRRSDFDSGESDVIPSIILAFRLGRKKNQYYVMKETVWGRPWAAFSLDGVMRAREEKRANDS